MLALFFCFRFFLSFSSLLASCAGAAVPHTRQNLVKSFIYICFMTCTCTCHNNIIDMTYTIFTQKCPECTMASSGSLIDTRFVFFSSSQLKIQRDTETSRASMLKSFSSFSFYLWKISYVYPSVWHIEFPKQLFISCLRFFATALFLGQSFGRRGKLTGYLHF